MAIMILKNGKNKLKKPKTYVKHFVYFTYSLASSEVELNQQITDVVTSVYT